MTKIIYTFFAYGVIIALAVLFEYQYNDHYKIMFWH